MEYTRFFSLLAANELKGLYLFHGEEEYIKHSALSQLRESLPAELRDMNIQSFQKPAADAILTACETLPFFAERRIVICRDMQDSEIKNLLAHAGSLPDTTVLVLVMRGEYTAGMLRQISACGQPVCFSAFNEQEAIRFVLDRVKKRGASMDRHTAAVLVDIVGTDAHTLENELNKALHYAGDGVPVHADFIAAVVTPNPEYQRYGMLDDFLAGRAQRGLLALTALLRDGTESVFGLAHFFTGQCKNMLLARLLLDTGVKERDVGGRLKLYPKPTRAALSGAKRLPADMLRSAVLDFSEVDYLQVSGNTPGDRALLAAVLKYFCA